MKTDTSDFLQSDNQRRGMSHDFTLQVIDEPKIKSSTPFLHSNNPKLLNRRATRDKPHKSISTAMIKSTFINETSKLSHTRFQKHQSSQLS